MSLKNQLIRLAHEQPITRKEIVPLVREASQIPGVLLVHGEIDSSGDTLTITVSGAGRLKTPTRPTIKRFEESAWGWRGSIADRLNKQLRGVTDPNDHNFLFVLDDEFNNEAKDFGEGYRAVQKWDRYMQRNF